MTGTIGIAGLGIMGGAFARNLIADGWTVIGYDPDITRSAEMKAAGVQLVHSELVGVLQRNGVEQFDPKGQKFDPTDHEALTVRPEEGTEPGFVVETVEKGYRVGEQVLRPARVVVSA